MRTISATGGAETVLNVSAGSGNTDQAEVHLAIYDAEDDVFVQGWFPAADLLAAVDAAVRDSRRSRTLTRITEPAADPAEYDDGNGALLATGTIPTIPTIRMKETK